MSENVKKFSGEGYASILEPSALDPG